MSVVLKENFFDVKKIAETAQLQAALQGAMIVQKQARLLCPVDTGELRQSISVTTRREGKKALGIVYTNKNYAVYVEFGTGPKGEANHEGVSPDVVVTYRQSGWSYKDVEGNWIHTKGQAAQPYMYPAIKDNKEMVIKRMASVYKSAFKKGLGK